MKMSGEIVSDFFSSPSQIERFSLADSVDSCQSPVWMEAGLPDNSSNNLDGSLDKAIKELMESPPPAAMVDAKDTSALDFELRRQGSESSWLPKSVNGQGSSHLPKIDVTGKDSAQHAVLESQWSWIC